ncbi:MAG: dTDP-4-dehydrorhamnose reductase [Pedobacter sp.]|nr:MAG: dTDP-4-dehydrorhamnose reductase [Pedobacter sp.]
MSSVLVIGGSGQLGQCLRSEVARRKILDITFTDRTEVDLLNRDNLTVFLTNSRPKFVVNCAAYTFVDKAEEEVELCNKINSEGVGFLAEACKLIGAVLIHISTDFVFDGDVVKLLAESDETKPINVYGESKLAGEHAISKALDEHIIIRTSWLYSEYATNFVKTMLRLGKERDELSVVADQVGSPTYAIDLANAILDIINSGKMAYGTYHYSNEGVISWYDFAMAVFEISNTKIRVKPIPSDAYPTAAKRPSFSVMDKTKIKNTFNLTIPYWRNSLVECITILEN